MLRRIGAAGPAWAGALLLAALSSGCGKTVLAIDIKPPASTPADGETPAIVKIAVTRDGKPVDDASSGQVTVATDLGQFAAFGGATKDDPTQQSITAPVTQGEAKVQLFAIKAGTANLTVNYTDGNGLKGSKTGPVTFGTNGIEVVIDPVPAAVSDGTTANTVTIHVKKGGQPLEDAESGTLVVTTDKGQFQQYVDTNAPDDTQFQTTQTAVTAGTGYVSIYSPRPGTAHVTAKVTLGSGASATGTQPLTFAVFGSTTPASIRYDGANPPTIGLPGSGQATASTLTFTVLDANGHPVADGIDVTFTLNQAAGGATLSPDHDATKTTTDGAGKVQTVLTAGTTPASVTVTATTTGGVHTDSTPITVGGAGINEANLTLVCDAYRFAGFQIVGITNTCAVYASDRNHQFVPNTHINLMTEAGGVPAAGVNIDPDPQEGGKGTFLYRSQCPFPKDVAPNAGEYRVTNCNYDPRTQCSGTAIHTTCNSRDGLATLVAWVIGEECFHDINNNGKYDGPSEFDPNCDQGEPYVDENDNGRYDVGEQFADVNQNGVWDQPNGQWDSSWPIWAYKKIMWTGSPNITPIAPAPSFGLLACGSSATAEIEIGDFNGNCPASVGDGDAISFNVSPSGAIITSSSPINTNEKNSFGQACGWAPLDANGLPTISVSFTDANGCSSTIPKPPPDPFNITALWNRTQATSGETVPDDFGSIAGGSFDN